MTGRSPAPRTVIGTLPRYSRASGTGRVRWRASSNEAAVAPSAAVIAAMAAAGARAHLYPSLIGDEIVAAVGRRLGVDPEQIVVGGGSIAVLQNTLLAYTGPGTEVVHAWRSYEAYPILVGLAGADPVPVPLDAGLTHDLEAMAAAVTGRTRAVIVCNPNNPTGTHLPHADIERFLAAVPSDVLVILDEAYREFADEPADAVELLPRHPNLAVFRTFSKAYGLAGVRAGYLVASAEIAGNVRAASPPFGLSAVAEAGAVAAWNDLEHLAVVVDTARVGRERLWAALRARGIPAPASRSNFVWIPAEDTGPLERACIERGVSVRCFAGEGVRVTVGDRNAEDAVIAAVDSLG